MLVALMGSVGVGALSLGINTILRSVANSMAFDEVLGRA